MCLITIQKTALKAALKHSNNNSQAFLYGSRVDDSKRGGDIVLFKVSPTQPF